MFEPCHGPSVYGVPLGADFPEAVVRALRHEFANSPPEKLARVHLIVNTRRMAKRIRDLFDRGPPCLLPRISLVTDFGEMLALAQIPQAVPPLRRRLELVQLVAALLDAEPDLAPRSALYDLADSLANLMDEMHGEGVEPDRIAQIDTGDQSGHWDRIKAFLGILKPYFDASQAAPDIETRQRMVVEYHARLWDRHPPDDPVIVAGSTGSRGATGLLMEKVAMLPKGAVILPGFDFDQPPEVWESLRNAPSAEDHPQFRFVSFMERFGLTAKSVRPWPGATPSNPARNRVLSLALRPAPTTDQWLREGPDLHADIGPATEGITLVEATSTRMEALAIAMRLRQAAEDGQTAALVTPDRMLTRQVTAALDRWGIIPDDSAGIPLQQTAPGRYLRHVGDLFRGKLGVDLLLTLLKHPLTHSGVDRGPHLRLTRELELYLRRNGPPYPTRDALQLWAETQKDPLAAPWANWVCANILDKHDPEPRPLDARLQDHLSLANALAAGVGGAGSGKLWEEEPGRKALQCVTELAEHAAACHPLDAVDYASLFHAILSRDTVRDQNTAHPHILIWGTLEARVQGADLLVLAGLNEGSWPEMPGQDPWLNRSLRKQVGLLLPERRVGLAAHDFQQAACAGELWLTRSIKSDDAQTVPARWLNRLQNLLSGLPGQGGDTAFAKMQARGNIWLQQARKLEEPKVVTPARRPAPCPPVAARPTELPVTAIKHLIRDPYAIYARYVLKLRKLDPIMREPDALLRGVVLHSVLEDFVKDTISDPAKLCEDHLRGLAETILARDVPWAEARALWQARIGRATSRFVRDEKDRQAKAIPTIFEERAKATIAQLGFTLTAKADRIDMDATGALHIYDYKTGTPPPEKEQRFFDKQLLLEAVLAERAGFGSLGPCPVASASFIGLGSDPKMVPAPLHKEPPEKLWKELIALVSAYQEPTLGYVARRAMFKTDSPGDYDHLARFGEWDVIDDPEPESVG